MYIVCRETNAKMQGRRKGLSFAGTRLLSLMTNHISNSFSVRRQQVNGQKKPGASTTKEDQEQSNTLPVSFFLYSIYNLLSPPSFSSLFSFFFLLNFISFIQQIFPEYLLSAGSMTGIFLFSISCPKLTCALYLPVAYVGTAQYIEGNSEGEPIYTHTYIQVYIQRERQSYI